MPKLKGPLFSITAAGTMKDAITYQGGMSGPRVQRVPKHRDMYTAQQSVQRASFLKAVSYWNNLSQASKDEYIASAARLAMTGYNLAVRSYLIGDIPGPKPGTWTYQPTDKDTRIRSAAPTTNYGNEEWFLLFDDETNISRVLLEFDITDLTYPNGIESAVLSLYYFQFTQTNPVGRTVWAYRQLHADWVELEATWNIYKTGSSWSSAGGDYTTVTPPGASNTVPGAYGWITFNVKGLVEDAIANRGKMVELLVKYANEAQGSPGSTYFHSKEYTGDPTKKPKLVIVTN